MLDDDQLEGHGTCCPCQTCYEYVINCLCCGYSVLLRLTTDDCCPVCHAHCDYDRCAVLTQPDTVIQSRTAA